MPRPRLLATDPTALVTLVVLVVGCRPAAAPSPAPPELVRIGPATARYLLVEHRHVEQQTDGQPIVTDATMWTAVAVAVDSAPSGFVLEAVVDSVGVAGDAGVPPPALATAAASRFRVDVSPEGHPRSVTTIPDTSALLDRLALQVQELLPSLPADGAGPGATWQDTTRAIGRTGGVPIAIEARHRHEAAASWDSHDERPVLRFTTTASYVLSGEGERGGEWISLTGSGTAHLHQLVSRDGLVTLGVRSDTLQVTIDLPARDQRIPLNQIRTDTLRRLDR